MYKKTVSALILAVSVSVANAGFFKGQNTKNIADRSGLTDCLSDEQTEFYLDRYFSIKNNRYEEDGNEVWSKKVFYEPEDIPEGQVVVVEVNDYWKGINEGRNVVANNTVSSLFDQIKFGVKDITPVNNSVKVPSGTFYIADLTTNRFFFAKRRKNIKPEHQFMHFAMRWYDEWSTIPDENDRWEELESSYDDLQAGNPQQAPHNCDSSLEHNHFTILSKEKEGTGETESVTAFIYIPDRLDFSTHTDQAPDGEIINVPSRSYSVPYDFFYRGTLSGTLIETELNSMFRADLNWKTSFDKSYVDFPCLRNTVYYREGVGGIKEFFDVYRVNEDGTTVPLAKNMPDQKISDTNLPVNPEGYGYDVTYYVVANVCEAGPDGSQGRQIASVVTNHVTMHIPGKEVFELKIEAGNTAEYLPSPVFGGGMNRFTNTVTGGINVKSPELEAGDVITLMRKIGDSEPHFVQKLTVTGIQNGEISYELSGDHFGTSAEKSSLTGKEKIIQKAAYYEDVFTAPAGTLQNASYCLMLERSKGTKFYSNLVTVPSYKTVVSAEFCHRSGTPDPATCDEKETFRNDVSFTPIKDGNIAGYQIYRNGKPVARISQPTDAFGQVYVVTLPDASGEFNIEAGKLTLNSDNRLVYPDYVHDTPLNAGERDLSGIITATGREYNYTVAVKPVDRKSSYGNNEVKVTCDGGQDELVVNVVRAEAQYGTGCWEGRFTTTLHWNKIKSSSDVASPAGYEIYYQEYDAARGAWNTEFKKLSETTVFEKEYDRFGDVCGFTATAGVPVEIGAEEIEYTDDYYWAGNLNDVSALKKNTGIQTPRKYYVRAVFESTPQPTGIILPERYGKNSNIIEISNPTPTSVNRISSPEISVYPNPATDYVTVRNTESVSHIDLYSVSGAAVRHADCTGENEVFIELSGLEPGVYFIAADGICKEKLIIK